MIQNCHIETINNRYKKGVTPIEMLVRGEMPYEVIEEYYKEIFNGINTQALCLMLFDEINNFISSDRNRLEILKSLDEKDYLKSREWRLKRKALIGFYGKCQLCGDSHRTYNVHHNSYENKPIENFQDLTLLCEPCHEQYHRNKREIKEYAKFALSWINHV